MEHQQIRGDMKQIEQIFLRKLAAAQKSHEADCKRIFDMNYGNTSASLTLLDLLSVPFWPDDDLDKSKMVYDIFKKTVIPMIVPEGLGKSPDRWSSQLGTFCGFNETRILQERAEWILSYPKIKKILEQDRPRVEDLEVASCSAPDHILLCFKLMLIHNQQEDKYCGLLPVTEPVKNAIHMLWGLTNPSTVKATSIQTRVAERLGISPIMVNSILFEIGRVRE